MHVFLLINYFYYFYNIYSYPNNCSNIKYNSFPNNFYIKNCNFFNFVSSTEGGVIFCSQVLIKSLISYCVFNSCSTTSTRGGAISFKCSTSSGSSILTFICATNCFTSSCSASYTTSQGGQFAFIQSSINELNQCYYVSITKCSPNSNIDRFSPLFLIDGNQIIDGLNSSLNYLHFFWSFKITS